MPHRPFLKWPGGKFRLITPIVTTLPKGKLLAEPFVGAGAVFLNTDYSDYLLNDINPDLINLFNLLKKKGNTFIKVVKKYFTATNNSAKRYYEFREKFNQTDDLEERSALFIYLNRHGFNGLVRYNSKGIYNVPFGSYKAPYFPEDEMIFFHQKAQRAEFSCSDFATFMESLPKKTIVYCDPPYVPLSKTSQFTNYAKQSFSMEEQTLLATLAKQLSKQGSRVLISNHATAFTQKVYTGAEIQHLDVQRSISCKGSQRVLAKELLALF
jgi:DNA adenine methylase